MVITKAGNLPCKYIFHLAPKHDQKSWKAVLEQCFQEAEKLQMTSLVLPPVGTGLLSADVVTSYIVSFHKMHSSTDQNSQYCSFLWAVSYSTTKFGGASAKICVF